MAICKILFFLLALCIWCGKCDVFYKQVGDEVSMKCGVDSNSNIEWKFNGVLILTIDGKSGNRRKGLSHIVLKASASGDILKVPRLETRDSGNYFCRQSGKQHIVHVVSVFVKPGPVLLQSSDAELHCDITGDPNKEVQWLRPNGQTYNEKNQVIHLKSVTSNEAGQWTCLVKDDLKLSVTLTVVGLQTTAVNASKGDDIELPCSLPQSVFQRVVGGTWKAGHLPKVSFPTLTNTPSKILHWNGKDLSKVNFTTGQLSTNFDVTLKNVQSTDEGTFVCTVEFDGEVRLSVETTLRVVDKHSGGNGSTKRKGKPNAVMESLTKEVYGLKLWIWIAVGASSVFLIGLIIVIGVVIQRNKRMKKRVRKLRSMRQPLTDKDYCQCSRAEKEVELEEQARPLPVPRQHRNTRTAGPNHTN
ncbi:tyrosine-protein kinase-like otk [Sinocyclocheilus rhinocerous]|uniref:tyrosine-protein kinase-like otk n=1 Tax=Sinocyclocheilus rhinocerous TaxID=307959 RepID=UPI0007BA6930|nr:PREDICTED: tyrosine-protein kinase-like otk [Sinocyclocheilus rhinocerous]